MKSKEVARLLRHPSLQMEGFVLKGRLFFKPPLKDLLCGFYFDSSAFSRSAFYVNALVMPLCVPTNHLHFTFGHRVRRAAGGDGWNAEMPDLAGALGIAMKSAVATFLPRVASLSGFVDYAGGRSSTLRNLEGIGYALARQGGVTRAIEVFDRLLSHADLSQADMVIPWHGELTERVGNLKRMLIENPEIAFAELAASEIETVRNLRLDEFREV
jgi:hypothetical protein